MFIWSHIRIYTTYVFIEYSFYNVIFYALGDDIPSEKKKLLIQENDAFDTVFPGDGNNVSPGYR